VGNRGGQNLESFLDLNNRADIVALWHPNLTDGQRLAMIEKFDLYCAIKGAESAVPLPGIVDALKRLHGAGHKLGVATNDSTGGAERTLLALGVAQMFTAAYGYDAVANPKPAPDPVFAFCDLTGLKPSEVAMVGDNRHDLEMGRAAGVGLNVGVLSGTGTAESLNPLADIVLGSVAELPHYLEEGHRASASDGVTRRGPFAVPG